MALSYVYKTPGSPANNWFLGPLCDWPSRRKKQHTLIGKMVGTPWDGTLSNQPHIYTLYSGYSVFVGYINIYIYVCISPLKGLLGGLKQLGYQPRGPHHFPYDTKSKFASTPDKFERSVWMNLNSPNGQGGRRSEATMVISIRSDMGSL